MSWNISTTRSRKIGLRRWLSVGLIDKGCPVTPAAILDALRAENIESRPGLTGWAQVNGRNTLSWEDKFRYDVDYVRNISFALDVKIVFLTVKKVFAREGISAENSATMEAFTGTKPSEKESIR